MAKTRVTVAGGKYTVVHEDGVGLRALRHGEEWRDLTGDGLVLALAHEVESLRQVLRDLVAAGKALPLWGTGNSPLSGAERAAEAKLGEIRGG